MKILNFIILIIKQTTKLVDIKIKKNNQGGVSKRFFETLSMYEFLCRKKVSTSS